MNKEKAPRYYPQGFISLTPDSSDGAVCDEKVRLHELDLSTKHVEDDSREA
ncbi:hypothetical protein H0M52_004920 [Salmonella enterica]|nr:hypothetical protein [Salmonella enterica]